MITKFKIFLNENTSSILNNDELKTWAYEYAKEHHDGFNSLEDANEYLDWFLNNDFPSGIQNIPNEITLYRYLSVEDKKDIKKNNLGYHYVSESYYNMTKEDLRSFFQTIGIEINDDSNDIYMVTIKTTKDNLELDTTIANRLYYPNENEWTLKKDGKYKIVDIEKINKYDYI